MTDTTFELVHFLCDQTIGVTIRIKGVGCKFSVFNICFILLIFRALLSKGLSSGTSLGFMAQTPLKKQYLWNYRVSLRIRGLHPL